MATEHTKLRTANLILASFTWRCLNCENPDPSAYYTGRDAINCAIKGNAEGTVQRSLDALRYLHGIGHVAYRRAVAVALARGFTPVGH